MKAKLQGTYIRAYTRHHESKNPHVEHNERFDSSLHDSYATRYFERLSGNQCEKEINAQAGEVLK